jgi:hypothetical protein
VYTCNTYRDAAREPFDTVAFSPVNEKTNVVVNKSTSDTIHIGEPVKGTASFTPEKAIPSPIWYGRLMMMNSRPCQTKIL